MQIKRADALDGPAHLWAKRMVGVPPRLKRCSPFHCAKQAIKGPQSPTICPVPGDSVGIRRRYRSPQKAPHAFCFPHFRRNQQKVADDEVA